MFDTAETHIYNPNRLYHFTNANAIISILTDMRIETGRLQNSNDLFEERPNVYLGNNVIQQKKLEEYIHEHVSFLSFAKDSQDTQKCRLSYQRSPMWGLYGRSNTGACLVIDQNRFERENDLSKNGILFYKGHMSYKMVIPKREETFISSIEQYVKDNNDFLFFQKQLNWNFEAEYRYVFIDAPQSLSIKDSIIGIILGHRFDEIKELKNLYLQDSELRKRLNNRYYWAVQEQNNGIADMSLPGIHPKIDEFFPEDLDSNED